MLEWIDSEELSEWMAMERNWHILPNGWSQTGVITHVIANALAPRENKVPWVPQDFMPAGRKASMTDDEIGDIFENACRLS